MRLKLFIGIGITLFVGAFSLWADEEETLDMVFAPNPVPWFTGPLLAPSAHTVRPGHIKIQPYFNTFVMEGDYDSHWHVISRPNFYDVNLRVQTKVGLCKRLDFQITPMVRYRETQGQHSFNVGDLPVSLNVQILAARKLGDGPNLKLLLRANIPTGKYRNLNAHRLRTDAMGTGCWFPNGGLALSYIWHIQGFRYVEIRAFSAYYIGVPVHVKGINTCGGDPGTRGTVYPGNYLDIDVALEYSLSQRWALACDFFYEHFNRDRFSGKTTVATTRPSGEIFSLAPAIEYNWSKRFGVIGGVWFSVAGRNLPQFVNGMLSVAAHF